MATVERTGFQYPSSAQMASDNALLEGGENKKTPTKTSPFLYKWPPIDPSPQSRPDYTISPPLITALYKCGDQWDKNSEQALSLINRGQDLDTVGWDGRSPLHVTLIREQPRLMNALVQAGANREHKEEGGDTLLHIALRLEKPSLYVAPFVTETNLREPNDAGDLPIHVAASTRKVALLASCFKEGYTPPLTSVNKAGDTALHEVLNATKRAIWSNPKETAQALLDCATRSIKILTEMEPQLLEIPDKKGNLPLHRAIESDKLAKLIPYLTTPEAKLAVNKKGETPFLLALKTGRIKWIAYVGALAVKTTADNDGNTPLHMAARNGLIRWIRPLTTSETITAKNKDKLTASHLAFAKRFPKVVTLLAKLTVRSLKEGSSSPPAPPPA